MKEGVEVQLRDIIRLGTRRGLDFVVVDELRKRAGVNPPEVLKFALAELLCNALDKGDASDINVDLQAEEEFYRLMVSDNGSKKLTADELRLILDFESKASSKRGFHTVSRGYLGNALKCVFGYSHALAEANGLNPPEIIVESGNYAYRIALKPDKMREVIGSEVLATEREDDGLTIFTVKFPKFDLQNSPSSPSVLEDLIFATSMVNPSRKINYNIFGETGVLGSSHEKTKSIRHETSALWYTQKQFESLFEDFVRAKPETQLKQFIALFRGFTSKRVIWEILQAFNTAVNHDCNNANLQFFPTTKIKDVPRSMVSKLFAVMKSKSKPIAKRSISSVLGFVGEHTFQKLREQHGWKRLRYTMIPATMMECPERYQHAYIDGPCRNSDHVEFPYLIELAVFDRDDDGEGLKVYQCVNFMASMEDVFSRLYPINHHLGLVGIRKETPVTIVAHLICPVLKWLNYGKSGIDE